MKRKISTFFVALALLCFGALNAQNLMSKSNDNLKNTISVDKNNNINYGPKAIVLSTDFEDGIFPPTGWTLQSTSTVTWGLESSVPITGSYSTTCEYDPALVAQNEKLISPVIDLTSAAFLSFNWNGSYYWSVSPYDNCDLDVYVSTDGGTTWGATAVWSEPTTVWTNWTTYLAEVDLAAFAGQANCKIAIVYSGTDGAAFSVDDILITNTVGINNYEKTESVKVYPNPASDVVNIQAGNNQNIQTMKVLNIAGQVIQEVVVNNNVAQVNVNSFDAGVYFIQLTTDNGIVNKKITVTK